MIETLFPTDVVTVSATPEMYDAPLFPEEQQAVMGAVEKRKREYAAGRAAARSALIALGWDPGPIASGSDRAPQWPVGVVGSIAHTQGICAVALAKAERYLGIGLDIEGSEPLKPDLRRMICTADELLRIEKLDRTIDWHKVTFSAKEAFYKCYYPAARMFLGFHDVELEIDPIAKRFVAAIVDADKPGIGGLRVLQGNLHWDDRYVFAGVSLAR